MSVLSIYHSLLHSKENSSTAEQRLGNGVGVEWGSSEGKMEGVERGCKGGKGQGWQGGEETKPLSEISGQRGGAACARG